MGRGAAHRRQSGFAHETAHDDCVHGVVKLLEKRPQKDGEEENQQLRENGAFSYSVGNSASAAHIKSPVSKTNF